MEIASFSTYFNQSQLGMPRGTQETRSLRSPELFPCPVTRWLEFRNLSPRQSQPLFPEFTRKATILTIFFIFWNLLQKNVCSPLYISSISHYFVISNHENNIIHLISKKNSRKKNLLNKKKFQIDFKSETITPWNSPESETQRIGFSFPEEWQIVIPRFPESPRNENHRGIGIPNDGATERKKMF